MDGRYFAVAHRIFLEYIVGVGQVQTSAEPVIAISSERNNAYIVYTIWMYILMLMCLTLNFAWRLAEKERLHSVWMRSVSHGQTDKSHGKNGSLFVFFRNSQKFQM